MRLLLIIAGLAVLGVVVLAIAVRSIGHDARWHVDPLTEPSPTSPNVYRVGPQSSVVQVDAVAPVYGLAADDLGRAFDSMVRSQPRTDVVGGSAADGWITYVQRSAVFGFPDYISVRFIELEPVDGQPRSTLAIMSRARFGESDLGVNEKRVNSWLDALDLSPVG